MYLARGKAKNMMSMQEETTWYFEKAKRILALAKTGMNYTPNSYDLERFEELYEIAQTMLERMSNLDVPTIDQVHVHEKIYPNPKVDIRAVVFENDRILLVQEKTDQRWSLPGGWADVGYSAAEVAVKELEEEAGIQAEAQRILAVLDNRFHRHPPALHHAYKIFISCRPTGGTLQAGVDMLDAQFFSLDQLPDLSTGRVTAEEIREIWELDKDPASPVWYD